jgi:dihydroneopterin aldolase
MDRLLLEGMAFFGRHGALPAERELGGRFGVDVALEADLGQAGLSDRLEDTVDYVRAYEIVREIVEGEPCSLLEAVAERVAGRLLELQRVERVTVRVSKRPPLEGQFEAFRVEVTRPL